MTSLIPGSSSQSTSVFGEVIFFKKLSILVQTYNIFWHNFFNWKNELNTRNLKKKFNDMKT